MAEIRIEGREVGEDEDNVFDAGHLYLVYVDDDGKEYVIGGGPHDNELLFDTMTLSFVNDLPFVNDFFSLSNNQSEKAILDVEVNVPIEKSRDNRVKNINGEKIPVTRKERGSIVLDLGGRDASAVWQQMVAYAQKIDDAEFIYDRSTGSLGYNSNTVIAAVLRHVDINVKLLPPAEGVDGSWFNGPYPGVYNAQKLMRDLEKPSNSTPSQPLLHYPEESIQNKTSTDPHRQEGRLPSPSRTELETPHYAAWKKRKQLSQQRRLSTPPLINIMPNGRPTPPPVAQERSFSRRQRPNTPPLIDIMPKSRPTPPPVAQERRFSGRRPANQPSLTDSKEMQKPHEQESQARMQRALHGSEPPRNIRPLIPLTPPDLTALQSLEWQKSLAQAIRRQRRLREGLIHAPSLLKFSIPE